MKSLFALCMLLILSAILSASVPARIGGEYNTVQPVTVFTAADNTPDGVMLTTLTFEWPEMPFAGYVPELGSALEQLPLTGYVEDMEHPPGNVASTQQATLSNYYSDTGPIDSRLAEKTLSKQGERYFVPYIRWSNHRKPWS